jgi:hypothetical protein
MRRRPRILLYATAAISLALAVTCTALQYTRHEKLLLRPTGPRGIELRLADGRLHLGWRPLTPQRPTWAGQSTRHGFHFTRWSDGSADLGLPLWLAALAFAALASLTAYTARRPRPHPSTTTTRCPTCHYDLRATPTRCPECGTPAPWG